MNGRRRKSNQTSVVQAEKVKRTKKADTVVVVLDSLLEECSRFVDIIEFLNFDNLRSLSCANKSILNDITTMPAIDSIWRSFLYSELIDEWKEYQIKIEKNIRDLVETHFGCRKIALAIKSNTCSSCGSFTTNLDLITCSRACLSCWICKDSGMRGTDSNSKFALCAVGYAKTHYLISDSEIAKNLLIWNVSDPDKCHGLLNEKIKVVNEKEVRKIAITKFGSMDGLAQEKTTRSLKSEQKWIQKCDVAKANGLSAPSMPDQVRKERLKANPIHTNFVCVNQRYSKLNKNSERYGYYKYIYGTRHIKDIQPLSLPTAIVTDATDEELRLTYEGYEVTRYMPPLPVSNQSSEIESETEVADKEGESNTSSVVVQNEESIKTMHVPSSDNPRALQPKLVVYTNLVDAVCEACRSENFFSNIIIDKNCNLPDMIAASSNNLKKYIIREGNTIGETEQANTLYLHTSIKFEGTENCKITSNNAIFWTASSDREHYYFKNLKMIVQASNRYVDGNLFNLFHYFISNLYYYLDFSPCFVGIGNNIVMENCTLKCCYTDGYVAILKNSCVRIYDCSLTNRNSVGTVFLEAPETDEHGRENWIFEGNKFQCVDNVLNFGGLFDNSGGGLSPEFFNKIQAQNEESYSYNFGGNY